MLSTEQIASIRRLFYAEHWKIGTIADQLGLHHDSVRAALETTRFNSRHVTRASATDPYLDFIHQTLEQYPRLRSTRLYQMLHSRGYKGSVIQLRRLVATMRPSHHEAFLRLSVLPAEQAQADWAHFGDVKIGRATRRLSAFVITLSYSRALYLEFFFDQTLENFFLGHVHAFAHWNGVPRTILFDNLKSVVLERFGNAIHFHPRLLELCAHYHFEPRPCRPARGNEKGRVERAIQYARHSFFAARSFTNLPDFNRQAFSWCDTVANLRPWQGDVSRTVAETFAIEQPLLIPLPAHPFDTDVLLPIRSDKTIYVRFDKNDYSIPHQGVGRNLTLVANPSTVRILDGQIEIASHTRSFDRHERIDIPEHIAALLAQKQKALGHTAVARLRHAIPDVEQFFQAAVGRGESVSRLTTRLLGLLDDYGAEELNLAVTEALSRDTPRDSSVAFILNRRHRQHRHRRPIPVDMSGHPELELIDRSAPRTPNLEIYDELSTRKK